VIVPDLSPELNIRVPEHERFTYLSAGYLDDRVEAPSESPPAAVAAMYALRWLLQGCIDMQWLGVHCCGICQCYAITGEFYVQGGDVRYVLPNMVCHYVRAHQYRLPAPVESAVLETHAYLHFALTAIADGKQSAEYPFLPEEFEQVWQ